MNPFSIVHFGPGAFHRAHQADYVDRLLALDPAAGIVAVSLRSRGTIESLKEQKGRYTLAILDEEPAFRTLTAHKAFLAPGDDEKVRGALANPAVTLVSSTVTEKGYCLAADGSLDFHHPDIIHDLRNPSAPVSIIGWLSLGLRDRRQSGLAPFASLCCDNMASNGRKLGEAVSAFSERLDPELAKWIGGEAVFPDTMVDSITPATTDRLRTLVRERGFDDEIPVCRERYSAWVVENVLPNGAPDLESVGVILSDDVRAWEQAKLRILNGAHSTLAYLGLLIGHETVADAMSDIELAAFVERLVRNDVAATLEPSPLDLQYYAGEILQRFRNPAIEHKLAQIAWDGSQKLPYRLLDTIGDALAAGAPIARLAAPVAAWILLIQRKARAGEVIVDPLAACLFEAATAENPAERLLDLRQIFPARLADNALFRTTILSSVQSMQRDGPRACLTLEGSLS